MEHLIMNRPNGHTFPSQPGISLFLPHGTEASFRIPLFLPYGIEVSPKSLKGVRQYHMISYYNEKTDSVDIVLDDHITLRLSCQKIFPTVPTTPKTYNLMVKLSRENPSLFAEMALDQCLESYLESLL